MNWKGTFTLIGVLTIILVILSYVFPFAVIVLSLSELFAVCALALLFCFLPVCYSSSELFSKLGVYHQLSNFNSPFGETGLRKLIKVYLIELELSILIFIVIFFLAATLIQFKETLTANDIRNIMLASITICPAFLLSLRLLANPVKKIPRFQGYLKPLNWINPFYHLAKPNATFETIRLIKERYISFYFSIVATVLITLIFIYVYLVVIWNTTFIEKIMTYFIPAIMSVDPFSVIVLFVIFSIILFVTTLLGETFLKYFEVIDINYDLIEHYENLDFLKSIITS